MEDLLKALYKFNSNSKPEDVLNLNRKLCNQLDQAIDCLSAEENATSGSLTETNSCPLTWKIDTCWPSTPFNTTAYEQCKISNQAKSFTTWHCNATLQSWNDGFEEHCYPSRNEQNSVENVNYHALRVPITIGHSLSLSTLVIALLLFLMLKRLHCTRIFIHMNLMLAFFFRGLVWIFHVLAFTDADAREKQVFNATNMLTNVLSTYTSSDLPTLKQWKIDWCLPFEKNEQYYVACRIYYVSLNYFVTASFYWLLVEGIYLALILRAKSPKKSQKFIMRCFLGLGWGLPWLSVICNVLAKILGDAALKSCWWQEDQYHLIIDIPVVISILINFIIFILVVRVVGSKLKVNQRHHADSIAEDYRLRLTKSTLALIPLLGIQYIFTMFFKLFPIENDSFNFVVDAIENVLGSIQGFLVALIYCFLNKEVRDELKRFWKTWKTEWELEAANKTKKQNDPASSFISSMTVLRKPKAQTDKRMDSMYTADQRVQYMNTMLTETSRLSTYSLKKDLYLQGAPSPVHSESRLKETCLCSLSKKSSLKSEHSLFGSSLPNEKLDLEADKNSRLSLEDNSSARWSKLHSRSIESQKLLSPSRASSSIERK